MMTFTGRKPPARVGVWAGRRRQRGRTLLRTTVPPAPTALAVAALAAGLYRVSDASLVRYELYRGVNASPDFTLAPWETFTTLPHTTAALTVGNTYNFVLRQRNAYNLVSQNIDEETISVDGSGVIVAVNPSDPTEIELSAAAAGTVLVTAMYVASLDVENEADTFLIYLRSNGTDPDPAIDTPVEVAMNTSDGTAKLSYTSAAFVEGTTVKVIVRTRRSGTPDVDSTGTTVYTATATLLGPAAVVNPAAMLGLVDGQQL